MEDIVNILKNIKVVGFDFDDTLVDEQCSIEKRWGKTLKEFSCLSSKLNKVFFKIYKQRGPSYKFHVNDTLQELEIDQRFIKDIVNRFLLTTADESLLKGAKNIIKFFKKNEVFVGIITDGKKSYQQERIKNAGIYEQMDFVYYGAGKKEQKPVKGVIEDIVNRFSIKSLDQFLFIGNDYINDIVGMARVGAKTCLVAKDKPASDIPDLQIVKNLNELLNIYRKYE